MKNYKVWLVTATVIQLLTAIFHSLSLFVEAQPSNETEKMMMQLLDTVQLDLGGGYHRTFAQLFLALSACFCLVCPLGGLINWFLLQKKAEASLLKGVLTIQMFVFGICFVLMFLFTFLPPIVLTGSIFLFLTLSRWSLAAVKA